MKTGDATTYEEAKKEAIKKHQAERDILDRKFLFGANKVLTIQIRPDPLCKGCNGRGSQYQNGVGWVCHCVTTGRIIESDNDKT